jgi:FtsP/CotA-like multicopper oxidase with cupredoxin domain
MGELLMLLVSGLAAAAPAMDPDAHHHEMGDAGVVMNQNTGDLPVGCAAVSEDVAVTVHAGRRYATAVGAIFGMSQPEVRVPPCSRVTVTFVNEDDVRHQWMVHGLPKYLYPAGMFHIEAMGGRQQSGTFIAPAEDRTYLIHCDMAQHMEKGMRGQLVVGVGNGDLWAVPGVSDAYRRAPYLPSGPTLAILVTLAAAAGVALLRLLRRDR